jgi:hypothetical protein
MSVCVADVLPALTHVLTSRNIPVPPAMASVDDVIGMLFTVLALRDCAALPLSVQSHVFSSLRKCIRARQQDGGVYDPLVVGDAALASVVVAISDVDTANSALVPALRCLAVLCRNNAPVREQLTRHAAVYERLVGLAVDDAGDIDVRTCAAVALNTAMFDCADANRLLPEACVAQLSESVWRLANRTRAEQQEDAGSVRQLQERMSGALSACTWALPLTGAELERDDFGAVLRSLRGDRNPSGSVAIFRHGVERVRRALGGLCPRLDDDDDDDDDSKRTVNGWLDRLLAVALGHFRVARAAPSEVGRHAWGCGARMLKAALLASVVTRCGRGPWLHHGVPLPPAVVALRNAVDTMRDAVGAVCSHRVLPQFFVHLHGLAVGADASAHVCVASLLCDLGVRASEASHWCRSPTAPLAECDPRGVLNLLFERVTLLCGRDLASPFEEALERRVGVEAELGTATAPNTRLCADVWPLVASAVVGDAIALDIELFLREHGAGTAAPLPRSASLIDDAQMREGRLVWHCDGEGRRAGVVVVRQRGDDADLHRAIAKGRRFLSQADAGGGERHCVFFHATSGAIGELYGRDGGRQMLARLPPRWRASGVPSDFGPGMYFSPPDELETAVAHLRTKRSTHGGEFGAAIVLVRMPGVAADNEEEDEVEEDEGEVEEVTFHANFSVGRFYDDPPAVAVPAAVAAVLATAEAAGGGMPWHVMCLGGARGQCTVGGVPSAHDIRAHSLSCADANANLATLNSPEYATWSTVCRNQAAMSALATTTPWLFGAQTKPQRRGRSLVRRHAPGRGTDVAHQLVARADNRGVQIALASCDFVVILELPLSHNDATGGGDGGGGDDDGDDDENARARL